MDEQHGTSPRPSLGSACASWREIITRYLDHESTGQEKVALLRHVEACRKCRGELELRGGLRGELSQTMSIVSTPSDRAAIVDAAREYVGGKDSSPWRRFAGWGMWPDGRRHPLRWRLLGDLVTAAAVLASILIVVQMGQWRRATDPTSGWASSTPVAVYVGAPGPERSGNGTLEAPSQIPRPF